MIFAISAYNTGQNVNTGISLFLIYKTGIRVLIPAFKKINFCQQILMTVKCDDVSKEQSLRFVFAIKID
jgi:hypothetical protein